MTPSGITSASLHFFDLKYWFRANLSGGHAGLHNIPCITQSFLEGSSGVVSKIVHSLHASYKAVSVQLSGTFYAMQEAREEAGQKLGEAWVLLGLLRLKLLTPIDSMDPAATPYLEKQGLENKVDQWLQPEKKVSLFSCQKPIIMQEGVVFGS